jgi:hypothetical protein
MVYGGMAGYDTKAGSECERVTASAGFEKLSNRMDMAP